MEEVKKYTCTMGMYMYTCKCTAAFCMLRKALGSLAGSVRQDYRLAG